MEDILGGRSDPARFDAFLADWRAIFARRVEEAISTLSTIPGLCGLILAGSVGRDEQWPLSDIDFLAIFDDDRVEQGKAELESRSLGLHARWLAEGWWIGVDAGKLSFGKCEIARILESGNIPLAVLFQDDRWYHSLDKGFQSRSVFDANARTGELAQWFTNHRFNPGVVEIRLNRERREVESSLQRSLECLAGENLPGATVALRRAGQWLQIWSLEQWGERDASMARVGTHFERAAVAHGRNDLIALVNQLHDLETASVESRMNAAPEWVWEWHDRAWRARMMVEENVTPIQHRRDVLRVCSLYELRRFEHPPFPEWLAIANDFGETEERVAALSAFLAERARH